jgi:hypothetical protein
MGTDGTEGIQPVRGMSDESSRLLRASPGRTVNDFPEPRPLRDESGTPGWRACSPGPVGIHAVPGHHATMVAGKYAAGMAVRLRAVINDTLSY